MSSSTRNTDRRHDLDALRASAMILGIVYHAALSLALGFPWMVQDPSANKSIYVFQSWVHGFRMPLFFIISGFFTAMLWKKRGAGALVWHRFRRILLPCIVGAITLVPVCNLVMFKAGLDGNTRRAEMVRSEPAEKSIWAAIRKFRSDVVKTHLDNGYAWTQLHPDYQTTALSWAAINGDLDSVRLLLERGCNPSIANPDGNTPLHASMFFGHYPVAEYLLDHGADLQKKNNNGESPIDSLRIDSAFAPAVAGFLLLDFKIADIKHGRELIEQKLREPKLGIADSPQASSPEANGLQAQSPKGSDRLQAFGTWIATYPAFSYLWFLWFLWWYAVCFGILQWAIRSLRSFWTAAPIPWHSMKLHSPLAIPFWIAITIIPIYRMDALGFLFGPDTSLGFLPAWHVFAYYAIFFLFGIIYYLADDDQARLGGSWRMLLPLTILVIFPVALEINVGTFGLRDSWISRDWIRPLSVLSQSLFAWCMSLSCIGLFRSCFAEPKPWIRYVSDSSYWLYVAHLPLVVAIQSQMAESSYNGYLKLLVISALSIAILLLSYQLLVRCTWIGLFLNGTREKWFKEPNKPS